MDPILSVPKLQTVIYENTVTDLHFIGKELINLLVFLFILEEGPEGNLVLKI